MLREELENAKRSVTTDSLQISIGEIASMYSQEELDIIPEFQRLFRWSPEKKTAFVESILIGIPVPPAFAYENSDGTWELIDGLQRISTILEFMGILRDPDNPDVTLPPSQLTRSTYLPSLDGVAWAEPKSRDEGKGLDKSLQLFFRRARLDFQILKHPSDSKTKFDLFQRLNRGGEYANEQEVRTCSMVLANAEATRKIRKLAQSEAFVRILNITQEQKDRQKDVEYAVRAIVHTVESFDSGTDVQEFLDRGILRVIADQDPDSVIADVTWAVDTLDRLFGDEALLPHRESHEAIARRFSLRALEGILVGIARNRGGISDVGEPDEFIKSRIDAFWRQQEVADMSASGLRGTTRIQRSVPFGAKWFRPHA
ncbi:hypothetical protein KBTX_02920 [wastewater metagenome]|uniref:GmrSD restriction endonucleases N-terminal domain-containing protein n=2 Tax=unclassified sequences TaxID=12908 RepID=A0A5B8RCP9_9ZZZZ|nr:DUF262 domain-containing protein [Arhodomonas sp. KWT]QEA06580.1 hypothetical protein KBTEX_02920 [uncultured organism]